MIRANLAGRFGAVLLFFSVLSACVPPAKQVVRDDYQRRAAPVRAIGVLVPDISYVDVSFFGVREKNDESSKLANDNMVAAAKSVLTERGFAVTVIPRDGAQKESLEEATDLFDTIAWTYRSTVQMAGPNKFLHKAASFDYSVGPVGDILDAYRVDALLLIEGSSLSYYSTVVLVALVDRSGALLWYVPYVRKQGQFTSGVDIRDPKAVREMMALILATMPTVTR